MLCYLFQDSEPLLIMICVVSKQSILGFNWHETLGYSRCIPDLSVCCDVSGREKKVAVCSSSVYCKSCNTLNLAFGTELEVTQMYKCNSSFRLTSQFVISAGHRILILEPIMFDGQRYDSCLFLSVYKPLNFRPVYRVLNVGLYRLTSQYIYFFVTHINTYCFSMANRLDPLEVNEVNKILLYFYL